ncbi:MAG: efflux transporter periplasmic adaptor subunit [Nevskia sp.]|nr:efflux transporter periplasmic adaptor subunit [Nevskia sp.]
MDEKSALLHQLRIDRGTAPAAGGDGGSWRKWLIAGVIVLLLIGAGLWLGLRSGGVPVHVATAQALSSGAAAAGSLLDASGYVVARRQATVSAKITGKVVELLIEEGSHVDDGQVVARLDDTNTRAELGQARAQLESNRATLAEVKVNLANAGRDLLRKKGLVAESLISVSDIDTAQTALDSYKAQLFTAERNIDTARAAVEVSQRNEDDTVVRAPFAGVITVKAAQPGEIVSPFTAGGGFTRTGIGTVVDMDSLEVEVDVNENFINRVHPDQIARVRLNAYPDWEIPAYVIAVIPTADRAKATVKVRIGFKQKDPRILPEMGARVAFLSDAPAADAPAAKSGVSVPAEAVQANGDTGVVFLIRGDQVERRAVKLGAATSAGQTVLSGLNAGDKIALGDLGKLSDGTAIRIEP